MQDSPDSSGRRSFPVAVMVEHQAVHDNRWIDGRWMVTGVVAGESLSGAGVQCRQIHADDESQQYLWSGLNIELHMDDTESYYANLMSDTPGVFVICEGEQEDELRPASVTLSYGEATSYMETDQRVERVAMPPEIYRWLEQYVLANYVPEKRKKRKRDDWKVSDRERR
jgi:hypothetical protein